MQTSFYPLHILVSILPLLLNLVRAEIVSVNFESAESVPVTASAFTAVGDTVDIKLSFVPPVGTALTVVNNTGSDAIHGTFDNLRQWQAVKLSYDGVDYSFVANYFGGTGNDLVLEWANIRLLAWGGGNFNYGQLGNGGLTNSSIPVPVDMSGVLVGKTAVRTATGDGFSVALCADGTLASWGYNYNHTLGNTSSASSSVPVLVDWSGIPASKTVVAIAVGGSHTLALCTDGSVVAWGLNSVGQLGGTGTAATWSLPILVDQTGVLAGKSVIAVATGGAHSLALCTDGTLAAWGYNSYGQLGDNSTTNRAAPVLVNVAGALAGKTVTAIAAGDSHSLALCSDGTLVAWGYNSSGQLGNDTLTNSPVPVLVQQTGVLAGKSPTAIAAGYSHSMVLCADGTLADWGNGESGQLGNGGTTSSKVPVLVNQTGMLAGKTITTVSAGGGFNLTRCADGTLATWGSNTFGSLGNSSSSSSSIPVAVTATMLQADERIIGATTGNNSRHSLAMVAMPPPPIGTTLAATDVIDTAATLNASVSAQGTATAVTIEYGLTSAYGSTVAAIPAVVSGTAATLASARLSGLPSGSTWHYRVVASSTAGTATGADMTFTTTTAATLFDLTLSVGTLFPAFSSSNLNYVAVVPNATDSLTLTPVSQNGDAVVTINGVTVPSGAVSSPLPLAAGNNTITLAVAAAGGASMQTYLLTVTRLPQRFAFNSATDTPITVGDFMATGYPAEIALSFAPPPGTNLTVVKNTGLNPIQGTFSNLAQGQIVNLTFGGLIYPFVANYFGGTGNDLVLQWGSKRWLAWGDNSNDVLGGNSQYGNTAPVPVATNGASDGRIIIANATGAAHRLALCADGDILAWGKNNSGQLGNNGGLTNDMAVLVDRSGVLAGKTVVAIAAGSGHSLALCSDGTLAAWGSNTYGQLGNHSTANASVPVWVDQTGVLFGKTVIAIAAGSGTSFALCADGAVAAWGDNTNGRLGNGSTQNSSVPVWVDRSGVLAGKSVVALGAGQYFTVVRCADGTLAAWGDNGSGQLGNNSTTSSSVPVQVDQSGVLAGRTVAAMSVGGVHSLALCADGFVAAWGANTSGQLGNSTTTTSKVPVAVDRNGTLAGKTIIAIAAGGTHSLALSADGVLAAWGYNAQGQLGVGDTTKSTTPTAVIQTALAAGELFASVHCGLQYSLAQVATPPQPVATSLAATAVLDTSATLRGTVNANGTSATLSFEYGPTADYGFSVAATPALASGTSLTAASAALTGLRSGTRYHYRIVATTASGATRGADMTFTTSSLAALSGLSLSTGSLYPAFFQTTTGYVATVPFLTTSLTLTPVVANADATVTVAGVVVASGSASAPLALTTGGNAFDVVVTAAGGGNRQTYRVTVTRLPETLTFNSAADVGVTAVSFAAAGDFPPMILDHVPAPGASLTLVRNTGLGWIYGTFANLAQGQPVQLTYAGITYPFVVNYFGGSGNDLVLQWANTRLLAWGANTFGQLGLGGSSNSSSSVAVPVSMDGVLAGRTVVGIASGENHSLTLCADGTLATWGYNNYGQLGNNDTYNSNSPLLVDQTGVLAGKTVVAITASANHNLALCADGALVAWGYNGSGQLGDASYTNRLVPVAVDQTGVLAGKSVVAIATGASHSLALCSDGTLVTWGSNTSGQLGNNAPGSSNVPVLVDRSGVLGGKIVTAIAAGSAHNLALCSDGTLVSWGKNTYGQLGNDSTTLGSVPVRVAQSGVLAGKAVTAITAGNNSDFSLCLCSDGTVAGWGRNASGQLGDGTTSDTSVPVAVVQTGALAGMTVATLAVGNAHSLARCADWTLAAWGANGYGQLGNNSTTGSSVPVAVSVANLRAGEHFMAMVGGYNHSLAITGLPPAPTATTLAATGIFDHGVTLNGSVSAQGSTTTVTLEYGPTASYGTTLTPTPATVTGTAATTVSASLTGLPPGATYHYHVVAAGPGGTTTGADQMVKTSSYATLANLTLNNGALTPAFTPANPSYLVTVPAAVGTIALTPVATTPDSTITVNGVTVASGSPCDPISLPTGETAVAIAVAAPDGVNTMSYTIKITRLPQAFTFHSAAEIPLSVSEFVAAGNSATIELSYVPLPGTSLTVVRSTGKTPILGVFDNLAHGQTVNLTYDGIRYVFVANYRGGTGNDLVLNWAKTRLLAWGINENGQLGGGATSNSSVAVPVEMSGALAGKTPITIAAGSAHSLVLCADGSLVSWGYNYNGQLGRGNTTTSSVPVAVDQTGLLADKTVMAVAAGGSHSLALCADGFLAAWGANGNRQLGTGGLTSSSVPVAVSTTGVLVGKTVVSVATGGDHNLALCSDGTLVSWGYNYYGQLGTGTTRNAAAPVLVDQTGILAGKSIIAIACGSYHSLALCADGTLASWGYNSAGQLGNGTTTHGSVPSAVVLTGALAGKTVATIVAGGSHSLALCTDGTLVAWGANNYGQLGNSSTASSSVPVAVDQTGVLADRTVVAVWAGYNHNLVLCADGFLASWGYNSLGQLGNNSKTNSTIPVAVDSSVLGAGERFAAAMGGENFSLALVTMPPSPEAVTLAAQSVRDTEATLGGNVTASGSSATVTFEYGFTAAYGSTLSATPATVTGTTATVGTATASGLLPGTTYHYRVVAKGAGGTTTGADMTFTTTSLATLADLSLGGIVLYPTFNSINPNYLATVPGATQRITVTPIVASSGSTVTVNGNILTPETASAWIDLQPGENSIAITITTADGLSTCAYIVKVARLAESLTFDSATTVPMTLSDLAATGSLPAPALNYAPIAGTTLTIVRNSGPSPIQGTFANLLQGQIVLLPYQGINYVFAANYFGGTGNDLVLQWASTSLLGWGANAYGQLGNNSTTNSGVATPVDISGVLVGKTVMATANGYHHVLALCADGTVAAWGDNPLGQLGTGNFTASKVPVWVNRSGALAGKTVVAIAASGSHSLALCADGTMAEWGSFFDGSQNHFGNLPALVDQSGVLAGKKVTAIAVGDNHSVALCADGTVATWGYNPRGELGNRSNTDSAVPVLVNRSGVLAGKTVTAIAVGGWHTLALCSDGTLAAWGYNSYGQLGTSNLTDSNVPMAVNRAGVLADKTITAIAAGGFHSLALCSDGTLTAWGNNNNGQLGNNSTTNSSVPVTVTKTGVFLGRTIVEISSGGGYHNLVRFADGAVATWGHNSSGQLGNNSTTNSRVPVLVPMTALDAGSRIVTAAAGSAHCMAVAATPLPPLVTTLAATDVLDTSATLNGSVNANAIERAVTIEYGPTTAYGTTVATTPGSVSDTSATPVSASITGLLTGTTYHYRVVATTGYARVQGEDMTFTTGVASALTHLSLDRGALYPTFAGSREDYLSTVPFGTTAISFTPVAADPAATITINGMATLSGTLGGPFHLEVGENSFAIQVAAAGGGQLKTYHVNVTRLPETFTWNAAADGSLSVSEFRATGDLPALVLNAAPPPGTRWTLVRNTGMNPIQGTFSNLAQGQVVYVSHGGANYAFVANYFGGTGKDLVLQWANTRLLTWGGGSSPARSVPIPVDATGALAGKSVLTAAAGDNHNLALCADGTLVAWGDNNFGQLGNSNQTSSSIPVPVNQTGILANRTIIAIAAGGSHSLALCADGNLAAWGLNSYGQLGDGTTSNSSTPKWVNQTGVLAGKTIIAISAGGSHSLALCADGTLAAWGANSSGQLGDGSSVASGVPVRASRADVLAEKTVVAIAAGGSHSLALCADGTIAAWGSNSSGQLGNYSSINSNVPVQVDPTGVLAGKSVTAVAAGASRSLALCADGTLAAWGNNSAGQLGNNSLLDSYVPVRVDQTGVLADKTVSAIAAATSHCLVLSNDGQAAAWGTNSNGQLGNFSTTNSSVPVAVMADMNDFSASMRLTSVAGGNTHSIALAACAMPTASPRPASSVASTTARLHGKVNASGNDVAVSFEYGRTTSYGNSIAVLPASFTGETDTDVSAESSNLLPGVTYHYRVVVACSGVVVKSADMTFTTISTNAMLSALTLSTGNLAPTFNSTTTNYQATVPSATSIVTVTPVTDHPGASVWVNGMMIASGTASLSISLLPGNTTIHAVVTAEDGITTNTYSITVTRLLPELDDHDHDGIPNLIEYAFDLDPSANSSGQLPRPVIVGDQFVIRFTQPVGVSGVTYGVEWSDRLLPGSWTEVSDSGTFPQHTFSVPLDTKTTIFMRLKVTGP